MTETKLITRIAAMFPGRDVVMSIDGVEVNFGDETPTITSEQVAQVAAMTDLAGVRLSFRDDSSHYDSCTIWRYVLVITEGYQ